MNNITKNKDICHTNKFDLKINSHKITCVNPNTYNHTKSIIFLNAYHGPGY